MLLAMVFHCGMLVGRPDQLGTAARSFLLPAFALTALVGLLRPRLRGGCVAADLAVTSIWLAMAFPVFANHLFLEWSVLFFLVLCRRDPELALQAIRYLVLIAFFYSGVQKAWGGQYFAGEFLASKIATSANFREFFGLFVASAEVERLVELGGATGSGPYTSRDPLFVLMSNAVWIAETALPALLLWSPTRHIAFFAALLLIVGIELGARELVFGGLFTTLLLLFLPGRNGLVLWPLLSAVQLFAVIAALWFPQWGIN